jgi:hypothetical protein
MRLPRSLVAPGLALAAALAFAACKDSTSTSACGSGTPPSVVGTYSLVSYTVGTTTIDTTSGATGQLRFYASAYAFNATIPVTGAIGDSGTYTISGTRCMSETSVMGQGSSSGTFTLSGTTAGSLLTFSGTNSLIGAIGFVGKKQ